MAKKRSSPESRKTGTAAAGKRKQRQPSRRDASPTAREKLADELIAMLPEIDTQGLLFLVQQATVLLHNKRIDELNAETEARTAQKREEHKRAGTTARVGRTVHEITVEIQRAQDGKTYYLIVDGQKHFFTPQEMQIVVKLCFTPERKSDALRALFDYVDQERREVLSDHGVTSARHPFFEALFYEVRKKFSLNE